MTGERFRKTLEAQLERKHQLQALTCAYCKGVTESGRQVHELLEEWRRQGLIEIKTASAKSKKKPAVASSVVKAASILGAGAAAAAFGYFVFVGGKLIYRLIKPKKGPGAK